MSDPIALRAIYAIRTRLQAIDGNSPYNTAAGSNIFISRATVDDSVLPCLIIFAGDETAAPSTGEGVASGQSQAMRIALDISVEGHIAAAQSNTGEQLEKIKADIKRALLRYAEPTLKDGLFAIGPIGYVGASPLPREDGDVTESVQCRFRVTYTEKFGDPDATK